MVSELWFRAILFFPLPPILKLTCLPPVGTWTARNEGSPLPTPGSSWTPHIFPLLWLQALFPWQRQESHSKLVSEGGNENHPSSKAPSHLPGQDILRNQGQEWRWLHSLGGTEGPSSTMQPENFPSCLVRAAAVQAHGMGRMECPVLLVSGSRSAMAREHLSLLPSKSSLTVQQMDFWPFHGWGEVEISNCHELKQHKGTVFTSQIRNTKPTVPKF